MKRRRVIQLATLLLFGGGFAASGAADVDLQAESRGQGWVRLESPDLTEPDPVDDGGDDGDDAEEPPRGEIRVQVVRDPDGGGPNRTHRLAERPHFVPSRHIQADDNGFLGALHLDGMNVAAETRIGRLDGTGAPLGEQDVAFMIANVGGVGQPGVEGQAVELTLDLYRDEAMEQPVDTEAVRFPWAIDAQRAGPDLVGTPIELAPREGIGVGIVLDGTVPTRSAQEITRMGLTAQRIV